MDENSLNNPLKALILGKENNQERKRESVVMNSESENVLLSLGVAPHSSQYFSSRGPTRNENNKVSVLRKWIYSVPSGAFTKEQSTAQEL